MSGSTALSVFASCDTRSKQSDNGSHRGVAFPPQNATVVSCRPFKSPLNVVSDRKCMDYNSTRKPHGLPINCLQSMVPVADDFSTRSTFTPKYSINRQTRCELRCSRASPNNPCQDKLQLSTGNEIHEATTN